jgi:hypothetical protein
MKPTAVEFAVEQLEQLIPSGHQLAIRAILEQAKEMEKQQIIETYISGMEFIAVDPSHYNNDAQQYYDETYNK